MANMMFGGVSKGTGMVIERFQERASHVEKGCREKYFARASRARFVWTHQLADADCGHKIMAHPARIRVNHYYNAIPGSVHEETLKGWPESRAVRDGSAASLALRLRSAIDLRKMRREARLEMDKLVAGQSETSLPPL